jgi:flagellar biogenesis protein FliO
MQSEKQRTQQVFQHARTLKNLVLLITIGLVIVVGIWAFRVFLRNPQILSH